MFLYRPRKDGTCHICLICGTKFTEGEAVELYAGTDRLKHVLCVPKSIKKKKPVDNRRFDRGRVIKKPGGL